MIVTSKIGQSMLAAFAAAIFTATAVGAAVGPAGPQAAVAAPAGLVAAPLSSQAAA